MYIFKLQHFSTSTGHKCLVATILDRAALEFWAKTMGVRNKLNNEEKQCAFLLCGYFLHWNVLNGQRDAWLLLYCILSDCVQWRSLHKGYWIIPWPTILLACEWSYPQAIKNLHILVHSGERSWGEGTVLAISVFGTRGILVNFGTINDDGDLEIGYRIKNTEG